MEAFAKQENFPIVGSQVGRLLELGSGFGYSAFWFAHAVGPEGKVVMTDNSEQRAIQTSEYLNRANLGEKVESHTGDGLVLVRDIEGHSISSLMMSTSTSIPRHSMPH